MSHNRSKRNTISLLRMVALQQNLRRRKLNFSIHTFPTSLFKRPNVKIKVKEDEYEEIPNVTDIAELQVSVHEVEFRLRNLDMTKPVARMEYQHPFSRNVVVVLHQVFANCLSLRVCRLPLEWKSENITPVHKKSFKEPEENYRPISLLPTMAKVLDRLVSKTLYQHVISFNQHGFLRKRSCIT